MPSKVGERKFQSKCLTNLRLCRSPSLRQERSTAREKTGKDSLDTVWTSFDISVPTTESLTCISPHAHNRVIPQRSRLPRWSDGHALALVTSKVQVWVAPNVEFARNMIHHGDG